MIKNKNILITGDTGFIGTELKELLISKGYNLRILSRKKVNSEHFIGNEK